MEFGIRNNRRGYVRISGSPTVVLDPGLNKLSKEQYDHVRARANHLFEPGKDRDVPTLEEVKVPAQQGKPEQAPAQAPKNEQPAQQGKPEQKNDSKGR